MQRILFVDDEPNLLSGLKRMLRPQRHLWDMTFHDSAQAALEQLGQSEFSLIISDMRMPVMDGAELLRQVRARHPGVVRLGLSGYSESGLILRSLPHLHQFLCKPCEAGALIEKVQSILEAGQDISPRLRSALAGLSALPCDPEVLQSLKRQLQQASPNWLDEVAEVVQQDLAIHAKILQLAQSGLFGRESEMQNLRSACARLGIQHLQDITRLPDCLPQAEEHSLARLRQWNRESRQVASRLVELAQGWQMTDRDIEHCHLAGVFHNLGDIVLGLCPEADESADPPRLGAYLLTLWGMPREVIEAVATQNQSDPADSPIHAASLLRQALGEQRGKKVEAPHDKAGSNPTDR